MLPMLRRPDPPDAHLLSAYPSFNEHWPECPRCSRISRDFKPPDFHPAGERDFHDVDGVELSVVLSAISMTEHAYEY